MAVFCSRCGTPNADGAPVCARCGTPLAAFAAGPPPGAPVAQQPYPGTPYAPQPYVPGQSMYVPPPAGGNAPHRTSANAVIAVIIVVIVVIAGAAVAFAALHVGGSTPTHSAPPIFTPQPVPPTTQPPTTRPPTTPPPTTQPPTTPPPGGGGSGATQDFGFATVFVPAGWSIVGQTSNFVGLEPADHSGLVIVESDPAPSGVTTNAQLDQYLLLIDQRLDPNANFCGTTLTNRALNGSGGTITADGFNICFNYTPQNGTAFMAVDAYTSAVAHSSSGTRVVWINAFARASNYDAFIASAPRELVSQLVFKDAGP